MNHKGTRDIDTWSDAAGFRSIKEKFCHELEIGLKLYGRSSPAIASGQNLEDILGMFRPCESSQKTLPHQKTLAQRDIPLHRVKEGYGVTYISAVALKLEKVWAQRAIEIACNLAAAVVTTQNFTITVSPSAWIHLHLTPTGIAHWLQGLCLWREDGEDGAKQSGTGLSVEPIVLSGHKRAKQSGTGLSVEPIVLNRLASPLQNCPPPTELPSPPTPPPRGGRGDKERQLFEVQYAHARCCSLLRLAHREGLISLVVAASGDLTTEETFPWLDGEGNLRLSHPAEMAVISQLAGSLDGFWDLHQGGKNASVLRLALGLSQDLLKFYADCRIFGEMQKENLALARARSGLLLAGMQGLKLLLENGLGILAPLEL